MMWLAQHSRAGLPKLVGHYPPAGKQSPMPLKGIWRGEISNTMPRNRIKRGFFPHISVASTAILQGVRIPSQNIPCLQKSKEKREHLVAKTIIALFSSFTVLQLRASLWRAPCTSWIPQYCSTGCRFIENTTPIPGSSVVLGVMLLPSFRSHNNLQCFLLGIWDKINMRVPHVLQMVGA